MTQEPMFCFGGSGAAVTLEKIASRNPRDLAKVSRFYHDFRRRQEEVVACDLRRGAKVTHLCLLVHEALARLMTLKFVDPEVVTYLKNVTIASHRRNHARVTKPALMKKSPEEIPGTP